MQTQSDSSPPIQRGFGFWAVCITQFMTAFVDNAFRIGIVVLALNVEAKAREVGGELQGWKASTVASVSTILMLLPYAFLSLAAGALADRFPKRNIFLIAKWLELPLVGIGMLGLWWSYQQLSAGENPIGGLWLVLAMIFFLGVQVAFLSPTRYGILPEIVSPSQLMESNGYLELFTFAGIFAGTVAAGPIVAGLDPESAWRLVPYMVPIASALGLIFAYGIPRTAAANPTRSISDGFSVRRFVFNWAMLQSIPGLTAAVFGTVVFWSLGVLTTLNAANVANFQLGLGDSPISANNLIIATSIGLGLGSLFAGRISRGSIELGLVPVAAMLWVISFIGLSATGLFGHVPNEKGVLIEHFWPSAVFLALNGFAAGMFVVPLNAFVEHASPGEHRASCIATGNIVQVFGMIIASVLSGVISASASPEYAAKLLWLVGAVLLSAASYFIIRRLPDVFIRLAMHILIRILYRIKVVGHDRLPAEGPALIVLNHTSFADGLIALTNIRRPARFIVYKAFCEHPRLRGLSRIMKAIPIDSEGSPKEIIASLRLASDALERGELVCIFAEGGIARTGVMLPFHRGMEMILKRARGTPIIPAYIDGMWGSIFSFQGGKFFRKLPKKWPYPVTVMFGEPMKPNSTVFEVRQAVQRLGADCWSMRKDLQASLGVKFVRSAWKYGRRPCTADTLRSMNYGETLKASVALSNVLKRKISADEAMVGVFTPPSVGGLIANLSVALLGRTPVNLNYTIGLDVIDRCIKQCNVQHILTSKAFIEKIGLKPNAKLLYLEDLRTEVGVIDKIPAFFAWFLPPSLSLATVLRSSQQSMDELATIVFSSGSTGDPKGVMLTHHNIVSNVEGVVNVIDANENDVIMGVLPFFHSFGYTVSLWLPLLIGAKVVYHFSPLDADVIGELIQKHRASIFLSTATFLRGHLRKNEKEQLETLRYIVCGAEKLPMQLSDQFENKFGTRPLEGYGCTELSPVVSVNRPNFIEGSYRQTLAKNGTIGHPLPGVAVRVVDPETLVELPVGVEGLLEVLGPNVMKGYLDKPQQTAEAMDGRWYKTGDIAKLDDDGFITITDRLSRFSKIGGEMVPHAKVEDTIHEILGTTDRCCIVVGLPDERKGERLFVVHVPFSMPTDQLWTQLKERLPPLWLPAKAAFRQVEAIPILGSGKPDLKGAKSRAEQSA